MTTLPLPTGRNRWNAVVHHKANWCYLCSLWETWTDEGQCLLSQQHIFLLAVHIPYQIKYSITYMDIPLWSLYIKYEKKQLNYRSTAERTAVLYRQSEQRTSRAYIQERSDDFRVQQADRIKNERLKKQQKIQSVIERRGKWVKHYNRQLIKQYIKSFHSTK